MASDLTAKRYSIRLIPYASTPLIAKIKENLATIDDVQNAINDLFTNPDPLTANPSQKSAIDYYKTLTQRTTSFTEFDAIKTSDLVFMAPQISQYK